VRSNQAATAGWNSVDPVTEGNNSFAAHPLRFDNAGRTNSWLAMDYLNMGMDCIGSTPAEMETAGLRSLSRVSPCLAWNARLDQRLASERDFMSEVVTIALGEARDDLEDELDRARKEAAYQDGTRSSARLRFRAYRGAAS
jgi:hypothetical protein